MSLAETLKILETGSAHYGDASKKEGVGLKGICCRMAGDNGAVTGLSGDFDDARAPASSRARKMFYTPPRDLFQFGLGSSKLLL